jgi:type IV pilus assembly protein PilF
MSALRAGLALTLAAGVLAGCSSTTTSSAPATPGAQAQPQPKAPTRVDAKRVAELEAEKKLERARIHTELAAGYFQLGNFGVALDEANEALKGDPDYAPAYGILGLIYAQLREEDKAEANFRRGLRVAPTDPDLNNNYGYYLCTRKKEKEGIERLMVAVKNPLYKTPDQAWATAGRCAMQSGDAAVAEDYFKTALRLNPGQPEALFNLADMNYKRGDTIEAKRYLVQLVRRMDAPNAETLWLGIRIERKLGDRNTEASYATQLRNKFPDSREALLLQAGRYD